MSTRPASYTYAAVLSIACLLAVNFFTAQPAVAQTATGSVTGTVVDPTGLAILDAGVVITNTETSAESHYVTNSDGLYVAPYLQPGHYDVTIKKEGFETVLHKNVVVQVGETLTINVLMPVKGETTSVTVTEETPVLEIDKTEQSQTVSQTQVEELPIATRRWENFVLLTPAVTTDGNSGLSSFRGLSSLYNGNSVDGANNSQAFFSEARGRAIIVSYVYSADSIKEFQVATSNYSAELGQAAGGVVNAVTKSGTNHLHGDLFWNLRYPDLNALDPLGKSRGIFTQTVHQQNQFGGSIGTPIIKDKLFFFGTYDGFRKVNPILYTSTQTNAAINGFVCPAAVSASACANAKAFILNENLGAFPRNLKQDVFFGKLDYQLNQNNHLSAVFNFQNWQEPFGYNTSPTVNNGGATQNGNGATHERFFIGNWTTNFSTNKVNDLRFQWGRDFEFDTTNSPGPSIFLLNIASYGETSALPRPAFPDEHRIQISDNFSWVKGRHLLKMGVDFNFIHELLINLFQGDGNYSYSSTTPIDQCFDSKASSSIQQANAVFCRWLGDAVGAVLYATDNTGQIIPGTASGITGQHYTSFTQVNDPITHVGKDDFYNNDYAGYVEDTWKVRPNITLNLGARYDLQHVPAPPRPNTASPLLTRYTSTLNIDYSNIAPRLGFSWQFLGNTVLRGGYGMFYAKTSNSTYYALRVENGVFQQTFSGCGPSGVKTCAPTFPNVFFTPPGPPVAAPFAGALTPQVVIPGGTLPPNSSAAHGMTPNFVNPLAHEAELAIERQLPGRMTVSASYLFTHGVHLPSSYDANVAPTTATRSYDVLTSGGTTAVTATVPWYGPALGTQGTLTYVPAGSGRLDSGTGLILNQYSVVYSNYNALVLSLRHQMSHGLEAMVNYTYSKALDDGQTAGSNGTFFGTDGVLDPYNLNRDYSYSDLDQRHRLVGSVVYQPNFSHIDNAITRQLVNGWSASGIVTVATGQPYSPQIGTSILGTALPGDGGMTGAEVSTFSGPTGGRASWIARNAYRLPNFNTIDFRLGRSISFAERYHLNFMVDAFNALNSTIVGGVNTTAYTYSGAGSGSCAGHTNGCLLPSSSFGTRSTTSGLLYGARQLQFGARFEF